MHFQQETSLEALIFIDQKSPVGHPIRTAQLRAETGTRIQQDLPQHLYTADKPHTQSHRMRL